ncbi:hypothetical protein B0H10DRAFT_2075472 [Mycena sp. CBHHK59/15]|nr:hypothetical protein B0H10DRAFT_2075472 [Mycena sp. CBHHK59/15]
MSRARRLPEESIRFLFDFCPPPLSSASECDDSLPEQCLTFYDRHLDEKLLLRRIVAHPSLISSLADIADVEFKAAMDLGVSFPNDAYRNGYNLDKTRSWRWLPGESMKVSGSYGVANFYGDTFAEVCHGIASLLLIRPFNWYSVLMWNDRESGKHPNEYDNPFMQNGYSLSVRHVGRELRIDPGILRDFDAKTKEDLNGMAKYCPVLATWQIYAPTAETDEVLLNMGKLLSLGAGCSTTAGFSPVPSRCTPTADAPISITLLGALGALPDSSEGDSPCLPKTQSKGSTSGRKRLPRVHPAISLIDPPNRRREERLAEELLQHGWSQAVSEDSSFIIYTNGNSERIGIRHRETQTLFLSGLIDIPKCNPAYARVHTGLCIAAFRDAVGRYTQIRDRGVQAVSKEDPSHPPVRGTAVKRGSTAVDVPMESGKAKRGKFDPQLPSVITRIYTEVSSRNLLLVRLSYGIYNSASPASFIRYGPTLFPTISAPPPKKLGGSYAATEYFTLTLGPDIATGATGAVHEAILEVKAKGGEVLTQNQQERMRNEFLVYEKLAGSNVIGVPAVFGIFDDIEGTANALVMNHCGNSLSRTRLLDDGQNIHVSDAEKYVLCVRKDLLTSVAIRAAFLAIIEDVHRAGIRHRDMRPANLLLDEAGQATIIDFDRAELDPLKLVVNGKGDFTDDDAVRTP